jgi:hypothetical protein
MTTIATVGPVRPAASNRRNAAGQKTAQPNAGAAASAKARPGMTRRAIGSPIDVQTSSATTAQKITLRGDAKPMPLEGSYCHVDHAASYTTPFLHRHCGRCEAVHRRAASHLDRHAAARLAMTAFY